MTAGATWLATNLASAPSRLREVMARAVEDCEADAQGTDAAEALGKAALALYQEVVAGDGGRDDALVLLAADALLTHAFHAQAELDPDGLPGFASRCGGRGEIGLLAERAVGGSR